MSDPPVSDRESLESGYGGRVERRLLAIYLQDHLAGAIAGLELARRARGANEGSLLGDFLVELAEEIEADKETLEQLMDRLEIGRDRVKQIGAWAGEKVGRLKLNGRLFGYSPLSRLVELEGLRLGLSGKLSLWQTLDHVLGSSLAEFDFGVLAERAERQRRALEEHRLRAADAAFGEESVRLAG